MCVKENVTPSLLCIVGLTSLKDAERLIAIAGGA
jgi:hypothetical protein